MGFPGGFWEQVFRLVVPTITLTLLVLSLEAVVSISTRNELGAISRSLSMGILVELYRRILKSASKQCVTGVSGKGINSVGGSPVEGTWEKAQTQIHPAS